MKQNKVSYSLFFDYVFSTTGVQCDTEPGLHIDRGLLCWYVTLAPYILSAEGSFVAPLFCVNVLHVRDRHGMEGPNGSPSFSLSEVAIKPGGVGPFDDVSCMRPVTVGLPLYTSTF